MAVVKVVISGCSVSVVARSEKVVEEGIWIDTGEGKRQGSGEVG